VTISATAADLDVVAAWLDAVVADGHFSDAWVSTVTKNADGQAGLAFTADVVIGGNNRASRPQLEEKAP
jgi:hypothetical protein